MAIVDGQGRLFGRLNLLDAVLLVLLIGLVPLGYAAYALFREQPPRIISVSPDRVQQSSEVRLILKGEGFRPYMRVSAGTHQAREFLFRSTTEVEAPFDQIPSGVHDIVIFDQAQERFRLPKALTIDASPLPATEIVVVGGFGNLDAAGAAKITAGMRLNDGADVIAVGKPAPDITNVFAGPGLVGVPTPNALRLPAAVRFRCHVRTQQGRPYCVVGDATIAPSTLFTIETPLGKIPFQVEQVRGPQPLEEVPIDVRFNGDPKVLSLIGTGDVDRGGTNNELAAGARVASTSQLRRQADAVGDIEVRLIAQLQRVEDGWLYESSPLRAGAPFALRTGKYALSGIVTAIHPPAGGAAQNK